MKNNFLWFKDKGTESYLELKLQREKGLAGDGEAIKWFLRKFGASAFFALHWIGF